MNPIKFPDNRGQSLVIFALVLIAMLAIAGLVIDGGMVYSHRRTAQAAADAAVLAGTYELCMNDDPAAAEGAAEAKALEYVNRNRADSTPLIDIIADGTNMTVDVTTHITFDTFFAHLVGWPSLTAEAHAQSGCACPSGAQGVLPVAWSCRWPVNEAHDEGELCLEQTLTYPVALDRWYQRTPQRANDVRIRTLLLYSELYILMDTDAVDCPASRPNCRDDFLCIEEGGLMDCDIDNDGSRDLYSGGNRSWLDLDGGGGGVDTNWITDGFPGELHLHEWLPGQTGAAVNVFQAVMEREGDIVTVPVYDQACPTEPGSNPDNECSIYYHTLEDDGVEDNVVSAGGTSTDYFHTIGFASFLTTCVDGPGNRLDPTPDNPNAFCPGREYLLDTYRHILPGINAVKTIEGYFIRGPIPGGEGGMCTGGVDTDSFVLRISQ